MIQVSNNKQQSEKNREKMCHQAFTTIIFSCIEILKLDRSFTFLYEESIRGWENDGCYSHFKI